MDLLLIKFTIWEDINLMHSLGIDAYRFSISWTRILPRGRFGGVNQNGVLFYNKLIESLLIKGIEPFVTLNHFDAPQELEERYGSWLSPLIQDDFAYFADVCFRSFGNRVKYWATINEPNHFAEFGYMNGRYPPGRCSKPFGNCSQGNSEVELVVVMHNMIMSHAKATEIYRKSYQAKQGGSIGIVVSAYMYEPISDDEVDIQAAKRALAFNVAWFVDPLIHGDYPPEMRQVLGPRLPRFSSEESNQLKHGIDFIGINHYSTFYAKDCIYSQCDKGKHAIEGLVNIGFEKDGVPIGDPQQGMLVFRVVPSGLEKIIDYLKTRYNNKPMFVTENGFSQKDDGTQLVNELLQDDRRVEYHKSYLGSLKNAIRDGADVRGYFVWSFMDNFEWDLGYTIRFGLYYVDYQTLKRIPKLSAKWFRNFLTNNDTHIGQNRRIQLKREI
ncbi:hypothetical protein Syun_008334 [Stephania yunnanensis]|uniref:Beta-glucosidase n=1 Tax=Stephania yunnanensis TaxID=152371 RepID=A0AAP0PPW8_9MAGN